MAITSAIKTLAFLLFSAFISTADAQCPNTLAVYNPNLRTACTNATYFIVPVDKTTVANAVKPYKLLPLPTNDASLFPNSFPAGMHPVIVNSGLESDIRMSALQLMSSLLQGAIRVPYVDRLGDGKTPFQASIKEYIGGVNGQDVAGVVPAIVASLGGTTVFVASFVPNNAAYQPLNSADEFIAQIKKIIVPNPVSGPGVIEEGVDTDFFTASSTNYTAKTFHTLTNFPLILTNKLCQRNPIYFNETFTNPIFRNGKVTLYSPGGAFPGVYNSVAGYSASGTQIGYNAESCSSAAAKTDPKALA